MLVVLWLLLVNRLSFGHLLLGVLLGIYLGSDLYFEAALLIAMMGFVGTAALSKYLTRGDIIE
ncbi:MAG: monovalent cation/H+ antiporter complex subunit F [Gammaproteobacteria bacterium]